MLLRNYMLLLIQVNDFSRIINVTKVISFLGYPLHQFNTDLILNFPKKEKHVLDSGGFQSSRNSIVYLQNQRDSNRMCLSQCETSISIRPILQKLISSTETQLNSEEFLSDINKVNIFIHLFC